MSISRIGAGVADDELCSPSCAPPPARLCASASAFGIVRVDQHGNAWSLGHQLVQQLQPLRRKLAVNAVTPVTLPPGRLRLATRPVLTGSSPARRRSGSSWLPLLAASAAAPPLATITATWRRTKSAASAGSRSYWLSAQRNSIATLRPSTKPGFAQALAERRHVIVASASCALEKADHRHAGCCARAASGHAAAAPPSTK